MGLSLDQQTPEEDLGAEHVVRSTELNNEAILLKGGPGMQIGSVSEYLVLSGLR